MMKYIIDIPNELAEATARYWNETTDMTLVPYIESDRKVIENEVWELARRIICPSDCCEDSISAHTKEIFNKDGWEIRGIFNDLSYQEIKAKYEAWKKQKEEIHVGDEVEQITTSGNPVGLKCVVTKIVDIVDNEILRGITQTGEVVTCSSQIKRWWRKTGRHFDEVESLLKKMEVD